MIDEEEIKEGDQSMSGHLMDETYVKNESILQDKQNTCERNKGVTQDQIHELLNELSITDNPSSPNIEEYTQKIRKNNSKEQSQLGAKLKEISNGKKNTRAASKVKQALNKIESDQNEFINLDIVVENETQNEKKTKERKKNATSKDNKAVDLSPKSPHTDKQRSESETADNKQNKTKRAIKKNQNSSKEMIHNNQNDLLTENKLTIKEETNKIRKIGKNYNKMDKTNDCDDSEGKSKNKEAKTTENIVLKVYDEQLIQNDKAAKKDRERKVPEVKSTTEIKRTRLNKEKKTHLDNILKENSKSQDKKVEEVLSNEELTNTRPKRNKKQAIETTENTAVESNTTDEVIKKGRKKPNKTIDAPNNPKTKPNPKTSKIKEKECLKETETADVTEPEITRKRMTRKK